MDQNKKILQLLRSQTHAVIATVNHENKPEAAFIGFAEAEDLTLIFGTETTMRKFKNIKVNPYVALTITDPEKRITVQYEGIASVLEDEERKKYKELYFRKTPSSQKYEGNLYQIYMKVIPTWIRYSDLNAEPDEIFEIQLA